MRILCSLLDSGHTCMRQSTELLHNFIHFVREGGLGDIISTCPWYPASLGLTVATCSCQSPEAFGYFTQFLCEVELGSQLSMPLVPRSFIQFLGWLVESRKIGFCWDCVYGGRDISPDMLDVARRRGYDGLQDVDLDEPFEYGIGCYDAVICVGTLIMVMSPDRLDEAWTAGSLTSMSPSVWRWGGL